MARLTGTRRPSVVVAVALAATVAAAGLWWLHGRPTILTDWREVARCTPDLDRLGPRAAAAPAPTACTGAISATVEPAVPGRVVLSVLLLGGPEDRPRVGS